MENNAQIISDLKGLINIANDGKEGYESASEITNDPQLKSLFLKFASERALYAEELKAHIAKHGGTSTNDSGGILGAIHRTWIDIKQALSSKEDEAILAAIETGENAALEKYEKAMEDYATHADHIYLLKSQRDGILNALKAIETLHMRLDH
ncbi:MAG: PA2169 family four-helix-bundle protein [Pedobacter sp.]|nr:PA2169 family four-helix-bundle protein [Pedobacter sp.]MDQ8051712.1 PA2169 family four-helix-bundle protein [Pedobacter sp.]